MFAGVNILSAAEGDEDEEQDEHDDLGTAGGSHSTVFEYGVGGVTKSVCRKAEGNCKRAFDTTFDVFTQGRDVGCVSSLKQRVGDAVAELGLKERQFGSPLPRSRVIVWVARRKDRTGIVVVLPGDSEQVCQCTSTKFRDEPWTQLLGLEAPRRRVISLCPKLEFSKGIACDTSKLKHVAILWNGGFSCAWFFLRGGGRSLQTSARQMLHPEYRRSSTGSVAINAMLPRRHCPKVQSKQHENLFSINPLRSPF